LGGKRVALFELVTVEEKAVEDDEKYQRPDKRLWRVRGSE
jgi:hypothetical protein